MNILDIKPGDYVRFRKWEDMEAEYGLNERGNIRCPFIFPRGAAYLCGTVHIVDFVAGRQVVLKEGVGLVVSAAMLEPDTPEVQIPTAQLLSILEGW